MARRRFDRVAIIGVGLIGGSIGLALKERRLAKKVVGFFHRARTLRQALKRGAVDEGFFDLAKAVDGAQIVIIATGVDEIAGFANSAARVASPGTLITDVGSVKGEIVRAVRPSWASGVLFVGSHPMAGSEKTGVMHARSNLFEGAVTIITPCRATPVSAVQRARSFWRSIGSRAVVMDPRVHDEAVARVSHLPHASALALCALQDSLSLSVAANGFRDSTRIAGSDTGLWASIFMQNRFFVARGIRRMSHELMRIKRLLDAHDRAGLESYMRKAKARKSV